MRLFASHSPWTDARNHVTHHVILRSPIKTKVWWPACIAHIACRRKVLADVLLAVLIDTAKLSQSSIHRYKLVKQVLRLPFVERPRGHAIGILYSDSAIAVSLIECMGDFIIVFPALLSALPITIPHQNQNRARAAAKLPRPNAPRVPNNCTSSYPPNRELPTPTTVLTRPQTLLSQRS